MDNRYILESKIKMLELLMGQTFLDTTKENYLVRFQNSNVVNDIEVLEDFFSRLNSYAPKNQNKKDLEHLTTLIETYTFLILEYKKLNTIKFLPNNLSRSVFLDYLRDYSKSPVNTKETIKEVLKELSTPVRNDTDENEDTPTPSEIGLRYALNRGIKRKKKQ